MHILSLVTDNNPSWMIHDQSPRKYGTGPGSISRPLDQQSDSHLLPDMLPTALRGMLEITYHRSNVFKFSYSKITSIQSYGPRCEKTCLRGFGNNKGADQPAHTCSLISAFVIRLMESIISRLATNENLNFLACLCSWRDCFESRFSGTPKTDFVTSRPICGITYLVACDF